MDDNYKQWTTELIEQNPETTKDYTFDEVRLIWRDHSSDLFAGWLSHEGNPEGIARVFSYYRKMDGKIYKEVD